MTQVPALALGTVQFGLPYGLAGATAPVSENDVRTILKNAAAEGVTRLDTAAAYGDIEERLAGLVGDLPFSIVSKIPPLPPGLPVAERATFVRQSIARSHARLGGLLVGVLFHDAAAVLGDGGATLWATAADESDRLGIALGVSGYDPASIAEVATRYSLALAQLPANPLDQRLSTVDRLPFEVTVRSLLLQGLLLLDAGEAQRRVPGSEGPVRQWSLWCEANGFSRLEGAIAVAKAFAADYAVVGIDTPGQWDEIVAAWAATPAIPAPELAIEDPRIIDPRRWRD